MTNTHLPGNASGYLNQIEERQFSSTSSFPISKTEELLDLEESLDYIGAEYTKVLNHTIQDVDLLGAVIAYGNSTITVTPDMIVHIDTTSVKGTAILTGDETVGTVIITSDGLYVRDSLIEGISGATIQYTTWVKAYPAPVYFGTEPAEDVITSLPEGTLYMQIEG